MTDYSVKLHMLSEIVPVKHFPTTSSKSEFVVEVMVNLTCVPLSNVPCTPNVPMYVPFTFILVLDGIESVTLLSKHNVPLQSNGWAVTSIEISTTSSLTIPVIIPGSQQGSTSSSGVIVSDGLGVNVGDGVILGEGDGVSVGVGTLLGVSLGEGVSVGVGTLVGEGVSDGVGVGSTTVPMDSNL